MTVNSINHQPQPQPSSELLKRIKENVPHELLKRPQWVLWKFETRADHPTKVPYRLNGHRASTKDRGSWTTFDQAINRYERGGFDGVGFVFDGDYVGIDIDHCRNASTGELTLEAQEIVTALDSYTEASPSGTGVHIYVRGVLPGGIRGRRESQSHIEIYSSGRYFTVTGEHLAGTPLSVEERQSQFNRVFDQMFDTNNQIETPESIVSTTLPTQTRDQILIRLRNEHPNAARHLEGGYENIEQKSETDFGVVCALVRCEATNEDIVAIMLESSLNREKFERSDYWETTIANAREQVATGDRLRHYGLTDNGNAERFVASYGDRVRYSYERASWLIWDGQRWLWDKRGVVEKWLKQIPNLIRQDAAQVEREAARQPNQGKTDQLTELAKRLHAWAKASESAARMRDAQKLVHSEVSFELQKLDAGPFLFNCANGTLDLRTGALKPHDPQDLVTRLAPVDYDPSATCPEWLAFLDEVFAGNQSIVAYVQRCLGYSLTADTREEVIFVLWGDGANGKSTLVNTISWVLGDYSRAIMQEALLVRRSQGASPELSDLQGVRFATVHETNETGRFDEARVKAITSRDQISARPLYSQPIQFTPSQKIWLMTNHRPDVAGRDHGIWRRLKLIPMTVLIPEERRDKHLAEKLQAEASGILAWCVQGCLQWLRQGGLAEPAEITEAVKSWRDESDIIGEFLEEICVQDPSAWTSSALVQRALGWYYEKHRVDPRDRLTAQVFATRLRGNRIEPRRKKSARGYQGLRIKSGLEYKMWLREKGESAALDTLLTSYFDEVCGLEADGPQKDSDGDEAA